MKKILSLMLIFIVVSSARANSFTLPVPVGTIHRAYLEYVDTDTVGITSGYGECSGFYWEITSGDTHDVTVPNGEDFIYIYIDHSISNYPDVTFTSTAIEPVWSDAKQGWYNGDDRCLGSIYTIDSSTNIKSFVTRKTIIYYNTGGIYAAQGVNPSGSVQHTEATGYDTDVDSITPVNASAVFAQIGAADSDGICQGSARAYGNGGPSDILCRGYGGCVTNGWVYTGTDDRSIEISGYDNDDNSLHLLVSGYQFDR